MAGQNMTPHLRREPTVVYHCSCVTAVKWLNLSNGSAIGAELGKWLATSSADVILALTVRHGPLTALLVGTSGTPASSRLRHLYPS